MARYAHPALISNLILLTFLNQLISPDESERRGIVYDRRYRSFLFGVNTDQILDADRVGNKTRFINHAARVEDGLNCVPKVMLVNGEHRIRFTALCDIPAGTELFFNYGKQFAEKHGFGTKLRVKEKRRAGDADEEEGGVGGRRNKVTALGISGVDATATVAKSAKGNRKARKSAPTRPAAVDVNSSEEDSQPLVPVPEHGVVDEEEEEASDFNPEEAEAEDEEEEEENENERMEEMVLKQRRSRITSTRTIKRPSRYTR